MTPEDRNLLRAILRNDFASFFRRCMQTVNPSRPLEWNWHLDAMICPLERIRLGEINRQIINGPPRSLKSLMVSVPGIPARPRSRTAYLYNQLCRRTRREAYQRL